MTRADDTRLQIAWLGHATVLIETAGVRLLTDPVLGSRVGALRRIAPPVRAGTWDAVDAVLVSHAHGDHLDLRSVGRLGRGVRILAPPVAAALLRRRGFTGASEVTAGSLAEVGGVAVEATPARHDGRRWPRGPAAEAVGFLVEGGPGVYFAGDTDLFPGMTALTERVDVALLPVAGWGPTLGPGHLDPERAAEAVAAIRPRVAIPIHWGTLAPLGLRPSREALHAPPREFEAAVARTTPETQVRILAPGERLAFDAAGEVVPAPAA